MRWTNISVLLPTIMKLLILFYDYGQDLELQRLDKECPEISKLGEVGKYQFF